MKTKIYRLTVFDNKSGLPLYDYIKNDKTAIVIDDMLFSGVIQGISLMFMEAMDCGKVKEIKLENATILIEQNPELNLSFVLIAPSINDEFRQCFRDFINSFVFEFSHCIPAMINIEYFQDASKIICECFPNCSNA